MALQVERQKKTRAQENAGKLQDHSWVKSCGNVEQVKSFERVEPLGEIRDSNQWDAMTNLWGWWARRCKRWTGNLALLKTILSTTAASSQSVAAENDSEVWEPVREYMKSQSYSCSKVASV
mmetsp:Transcript_108879/g.171674  ORF Transcript_108879/g.171674 Transcript_108879/m.171674 type:complete len:121 (+) Transcript_108879:200-562(+)